MDLLKDLIRDLIGIIFPGTLLVIFYIWFIAGIAVSFEEISWENSVHFSNLMDKSLTWFVLLVISFVAGQFLRIKTLEGLDKKSTVYAYWKSLGKQRFAERLKQKVFVSFGWMGNKMKEELEGKRQEIYAKIKSAFEKDKKEKERIEDFQKLKREISGLEYFPYYWAMRLRQKLGLPQRIVRFYDKFYEQGIFKGKSFFNFCTLAIFEYSPALKEEVLRAESLVRLLAGAYYAFHQFLLINLGLFIYHLIIVIAASIANPGMLLPNPVMLLFSAFFILVSIFVKQEVLTKLPRRRAKEANLVFDGFYLISLEREEINGLAQNVKRKNKF